MNKYQEIINSGQPVLIDFYATWCGPCQTVSPIVEAVGKEMQGQARILKIDVDKNRPLATSLQIQAVPTLVIYKNGKVVWRHSGGIDKQSLKNTLLSFT
ncbi:MAG: thioredoxin [Paludibacteraceae bacterium]